MKTDDELGYCTGDDKMKSPDLTRWTPPYRIFQAAARLHIERERRSLVREGIIAMLFFIAGALTVAVVPYWRLLSQLFWSCNS